LFRQDGKSRKKSNLIIFVTPSIVESEDFQTYKSQFLKTKLEDKKEPVEPAWDTGKPASKDRPLF
jgi:type II secretory pathway component GspD/PulD (secretin)